MKALVLAGGLSQIELLNQLKARNITTVLADGNANALARPYADVFYQLPIFDIEAVKEVALKEKVDFLITVCADQVLLVVAQVSEMLGLPWYTITIAKGAFVVVMALADAYRSHLEQTR